MSQTLQTVLLSLATSLIVSLITFILGLKSGKNQTDRAKLQNLYRDLYSHFSDLKESLQRNRPKSWMNYKKIERGSYTIEYYPPVKELKRTGDILFLKKKIAEEALDLETQIMNYSYELSQHIPALHAALIADMEIYKEGYSFAPPRRGDNETAHFETANPQNCRTFRAINYRIFYSREETIALFQQMQANAATAIEFTDGGNPPNHSAKIYPDGATISGQEYAEYILSLFEKNVSGYIALCNRRKELMLQIDKLNKKLAQKAKEPVGFWETILGAFADMFR